MQAQTRTAEHTYLVCPICRRGKIMLEDRSADGHALRLIPPGGAQKARWHIKCNICKSQIGIFIQP